MDGERFDALARTVARAGSSRRAVIRGIVGGALGAAGLRSPGRVTAQDGGVCVTGITCEQSSLDFACGPGEAPDITCVCYVATEGDVFCGKNGCSGPCQSSADCAPGWFCATGTCCDDPETDANACVEFCRCPAGYADCDGLCLDVSSDPANCGDCGNACPQPADPNAVATCADGACGEACAAGFDLCDDGCADLQGDTDNCGACGAACGEGEACCGGSCVDLAADAAHCGACAIDCNSGEPELGFVCVDGGCVCPAGYVACGGACFVHDERRCHDCIRCAEGMTCVDSNCVCPSGAVCNGDDVFFGPRFTCCGDTCCPNSTCREGEPCLTTCVDGLCRCNGTDLVWCGDGCVDLATDPSNCGACGTVCAAGAACVDGACPTAGGASVTIHKATCPTGVGPDIFATCHGNALAGVPFDVGGAAVVTGTDGAARATVAAGTVTVAEEGDAFAGYLGAYVYCSEQDSGTVLYDGSADTGAVTFAVDDGDDVVCDWYNITSAEEGGAEVTPTATSTAVAGTSLPETGVGGTAPTSTPWLGAAIVAGAGAIVAANRVRKGRPPADAE